MLGKLEVYKILHKYLLMSHKMQLMLPKIGVLVYKMWLIIP
jgi:hypothetical protein